jgi:hypothetical protein
MNAAGETELFILPEADIIFVSPLLRKLLKDCDLEQHE